MVYKLSIVQNGTEQGSFLVGNRQFAKIPAKKGMLIQVIDEKGELVVAPKTKIVGNDLWVILEGDARRPEVIIENYTKFSPISSLENLKSLNATLAMGGAVAAASVDKLPADEEAQQNLIEKTQETHNGDGVMESAKSQDDDLAMESSRDAELAREMQQADTGDVADADVASGGGSSWGMLAIAGAVGVGAVAAGSSGGSSGSSSSNDGSVTSAQVIDAVREGEKFNFDALLTANDRVDFDKGDTVQLKQSDFSQLSKGILNDDMRDEYFTYDEATHELRYDADGASVPEHGYETFAVLNDFEGTLADIRFEVI